MIVYFEYIDYIFFQSWSEINLQKSRRFLAKNSSSRMSLPIYNRVTSDFSTIKGGLLATVTISFVLSTLLFLLSVEGVLEGCEL